MRLNSSSIALCAILIAGLSSGALLAQDQSQPAEAPSATSQATPSAVQPHRAPNPQHQVKMMARRLGLSQDQVAKIEPILADRVQRVQSARADTTLAPRDRRAAIKRINHASNASIEAILNDTQRQQYEQIKQNRRNNRQQPNGPTSSNG